MAALVHIGGNAADLPVSIEGRTGRPPARVPRKGGMASPGRAQKIPPEGSVGRPGRPSARAEPNETGEAFGEG